MLARDNLHRYQNRGVEFVFSRLNSALWLDLGLGKTVTTLTAIKDLLDAVDVYRVLVIAPLRVAKTTWPDEIGKWSHLHTMSYAVACGSAKERISALAQNADVTLINIENIPWLVEYYGKKWPFDMVVIDESSAFKSHSSKRFKQLRRVRRAVHRMVQLTGTPSPNGLHQLWPQIFLLDKGERLGATLGAFRREFCTSYFMGPHQKWRVDPERTQDIQDKLRDIVLTMNAKDYLDMPSQIDVFHDIELSEKERAIYKELETEFLITTFDDEEISAVNAAALSNKLLQFAGGAVYLDEGGYSVFHDRKLDKLEDLVNDMNDAPMLVAYQYKSDLARLKKRFPSAVVLDKNPDTIARFNNGQISILLAHPASAGHGLNLQAACNVMVWFSLTWNLEHYLQFIGRLVRQGQKQRTVMVHHLNATKTIDSVVAKAIKNKNLTQENLLNGLKEINEAVANG